jgi:hypothetical protein
LNFQSIYWSCLIPIWAIGGDHFEDDAAEMSAEGADGLVVGFTFRAFVFVITLRLRNPFAVPVDRRHHRGLGAFVDVTGWFRAIPAAR